MLMTSRLFSALLFCTFAGPAVANGLELAPVKDDRPPAVNPNEAMAKALISASDAFTSASQAFKAVSTKDGRGLSLKDALVLLFGTTGLATGIGGSIWRQWRAKRDLQTQKLDEFVKELRHPDLLEIIYFVENPTITPTINGERLRGLPAILESMLDDIDAGRLLAQEVKKRWNELFIRCAEHRFTWKDESKEKRDKYWKKFFDFAKNIKSDICVPSHEVIAPTQ